MADGPFRQGNHWEFSIVHDPERGEETGELWGMALRGEWAAEIVAALNGTAAPNQTAAGPVADGDWRELAGQIAEAGIAKFRTYTGTVLNQNMWNVDIEKTFHLVAEDQALVVSHALKTAYLSGHDSGFAAANVSDPWAEQPVVDSELRDRIAEVARDESGTREGSQQFAPIYWDDVAQEIYIEVVAPVLAARDTEIQRLRQQVDFHLKIRMGVEEVLDEVIGTEVENGAGEGLVSDVNLLAQRYKDTLAENEKLRKQVQMLGNALQRTAYTDKDVAERDAEHRRRLMDALEIGDTEGLGDLYQVVHSLVVEHDKADAVIQRREQERDAYREASVQNKKNWDAARNANMKALETIQLYEANFREINLQLAEMVDADDQLPLPDLLGKVKAELDLRFATRQQYAEERDEAET